MNIARHAAASKVTKQRQSEGVAHGVDVQVWDKLRQSLPSQEDAPHALSQQGEVGKQAGLHQQPVPQEHKVNRPGEHDVEAASRSVQDLLARHTHVPCVHHKVDVCVPVQVKVGLHKQMFNQPSCKSTTSKTHTHTHTRWASPMLQGPDGTPEHPLSPPAGITVGVEEGHRGPAVPRPPSAPVALQPEPHSQHQQDQHGDEQQAQEEQGQQQLPQQPEAQQRNTMDYG